MSHQHLEVPRFPRGFILSERPVEPPPTFVRGPILENFYVHPWTNVETAGNANLFVVILGHCVPTLPEQSNTPARDLLVALSSGVGSFLEVLDEYSGRHAIIFGNVGNMNVVNDATAMRSVFYAATGGIIASHATLVEQALDGTIVQDKLPFRYGYPGNRTPYAQTRILTANTYYWITANVVRRFWPIVTPPSKTVDEAAAVLLESSAVALRAMSAEKTTRLSLTAGLDSRAMLAVALHAGIPFETYTFGDEATSKIDPAIGVELSQQYGLDHTLVGSRVKHDQLMHRLRESHYAFHNASWVGALREYFQDVTDVAVLGNLLEIGRNKYPAARGEGILPPDTANNMVGLQYRYLGAPLTREVDQYGVDRYWDESVSAFQAFIDDTGYDLVDGLLDPFDLFYWEHRMSTWQGVAMGERDFYGDPFIPFNSRRIFETMLGVPAGARNKDHTVKRMMEMVDLGLFNLPVNPKRWPSQKAAANV